MANKKIITDVVIHLRNVPEKLARKLELSYEVNDTVSFIRALGDHFDSVSETDNLTRGVRNVHSAYHNQDELVEELVHDVDDIKKTKTDKMIEQVSYEMTPDDMKRLMKSRSISTGEILRFNTYINSIEDLEKAWKK